VNRISSNSLYIFRTVFPALWFGHLAFFFALVLMTGGWRDGGAIFLILPAALAVGGYLMMKFMVWDLVDEVWDAGDHLVARQGGKAERVELADILWVRASRLMRPARITLELSPSARPGGKIAFMPRLPASYVPASGFALAQDLAERVERARRAAS
jgi:hypothetical protein